MGIGGLAPSATLLGIGVLLDAAFGDPQVAWHPIRLVGKTIAAFERLLRRFGADGYAGGCILFLMLSATWVALPCLVITKLYERHEIIGGGLHLLVIYICFALRDLIHHVQKVRRAAKSDDTAAAQKAIGMLVGRDTSKMDVAACRRAAIESLSENFVDGVLSAVFWYALFGIPGLLVFKLVSTMDSMVGYRNARYLHFGWCGARLDDVMNYIPARLTWLLLGLFGIPKAWRIGLAQHGVLPGPNPGWSEATMAGVLQRRLIGPIWKEGKLVTEVWLGDPKDAIAGTDRDVVRALLVIVVASAITVVIGMLLI